MLRLRLASGLAVELLDDAGRAAAEQAAADGLLDPVALTEGRAVLTSPRAPARRRCRAPAPRR